MKVKRIFPAKFTCWSFLTARPAASGCLLDVYDVMMMPMRALIAHVLMKMLMFSPVFIVGSVCKCGMCMCEYGTHDT